MARISEILLMEPPAQHLLVMRKTIDFLPEYSDFAAHCFAAIGGYLQSLGMPPGGGPVVCFHNQELTHLDVEIGFPVAKAVPDHEEIRYVLRPSRRVVTAIDLGPYEEQDPTLMELLAWADTNGHKTSGPIYYQYLNGPERPPHEFLTLMSLPLK